MAHNGPKQEAFFTQDTYNTRQHSSIFKVLTHQENALHVYFHSPGPIFSKMNFWGCRGIWISEILEMQGYRMAERLLFGREAATSRWVGTIKETSCLKPAAFQSDLSGLHSFLWTKTTAHLFAWPWSHVSSQLLLSFWRGYFPPQSSLLRKWVNLHLNQLSSYPKVSVFNGGHMLVAHSLSAPELMPEIFDFSYDLWNWKVCRGAACTVACHNVVLHNNEESALFRFKWG